jgi:hypothetical protein
MERALLEWRVTVADFQLYLAQRKLGRAIDEMVRKYRPDQPRAPKGTPEGGQWVAEHVRVAAGALCDGFSGGCQSGGTYGASGMISISGKKLCWDCAVKYLGIERLPRDQQLETLRLFDRNIRE